MKKHISILTLGFAVLMGTGMALAEESAESMAPPEASVPQAAPDFGSQEAAGCESAPEAEPNDESAAQLWTPAETPASPGLCQEDVIPICSDPCCPQPACQCNFLTGVCKWTCLCVC